MVSTFNYDTFKVFETFHSEGSEDRALIPLDGGPLDPKSKDSRLAKQYSVFPNQIEDMSVFHLGRTIAPENFLAFLKEKAHRVPPHIYANYTFVVSKTSKIRFPTEEVEDYMDSIKVDYQHHIYTVLNKHSGNRRIFDSITDQDLDL